MEEERRAGLCNRLFENLFPHKFLFFFFARRGVRVKNEPMVASSQPNDAGKGRRQTGRGFRRVTVRGGGRLGEASGG